jgi:hypothetical protein
MRLRLHPSGEFPHSLDPLLPVAEQRIAFRISINVGASNLLYRTAAHECPDQEIMQDLREGGMTLSEERRPAVLSTINRVGHTYNVAFRDGQVERFVHDQSHVLL